MREFKGFTIAELTVAMAVLGVLLAMTIPVLTNTRPDKNGMMIRKSYYTYADAISEMVNSVEYPWVDGACPDNNGSNYTGFDCNVTTAKFPCMFSQYVNTDERYILNRNAADAVTGCSSVSGALSASGGNYVITTTDEVIWYFPEAASFVAQDATSHMDVVIDINGEKGPNCLAGSENCNNFDRFTIRTYADGMIEVVEHDALLKIRLDSTN